MVGLLNLGVVPQCWPASATAPSFVIFHTPGSANRDWSSDKACGRGEFDARGSAGGLAAMLAIGAKSGALFRSSCDAVATNGSAPRTGDLRLVIILFRNDQDEGGTYMSRICCPV